MIVLDTNVKVKSATTQYQNFNYNSMVRFGDDFFCASENGLFKLSGDSDSGEAITSYFEPFTIDFGISNPKKLRYVYASYEASADWTIVITSDLGYTDTITFPSTTGGQQAKKKTVRRGVRGRFFVFQIRSVGVDLSLDELKVLPIILSHGHDKN